jgi:hypothetical protein
MTRTGVERTNALLILQEYHIVRIQSEADIRSVPQDWIKPRARDD